MDGDARIGTIVDGRYRIERKLGDGGVGIVYAGEHLSLRKPVAIKFLREQYAFHRAMRPRFEREARALAQIRHPNIVEVTDYGVIGDVPYLVMELLEGQTLDQLIDGGGLDPMKGVSLMRDILRGLAFAHAQGIVHRDLKPANVFVQRVGADDHIKILDFGFVKFVEDESDEKKLAETPLTRSGIAFGTPAYMSPEQATGAPTDATTDVYSAGVLFFELLTGSQPYKGELPEIVRQHLAAPVPALASARPLLVASPELQSIVRRAMAKEPRDRFADAIAFLKAVEALPRNAASLRSSQKSQPFDPTVPAERRTDVETAKVRTVPPPRKSGSRWLLPFAFAGACLAGWYAWDQGWLADFLGDSSGAGAVEPTELIAHNIVTEPDPTAMREPPAPIVEDAGAVVAPAIDAGFDAGPPDAGFDGGPPDAGAPDAGHDGGVDAGPPRAADPIATVRPGDRPRDPFADEDMPRVLRSFYERMNRGDTIGEAGIRVLTRYGRDHRDDPRVHLLLAHVFVRRRWLADAVERYDLVELSKTDQYGERAANLLVTAYGSEAATAVDRELERRDLDRRSEANLRRLRRRL
jgi:tRNA A-37 threonylcarbamoyl transferase component Bud32